MNWEELNLEEMVPEFTWGVEEKRGVEDRRGKMSLSIEWVLD